MIVKKGRPHLRTDQIVLTYHFGTDLRSGEPAISDRPTSRTLAESPEVSMRSGARGTLISYPDVRVGIVPVGE
jgi:hypothetical protein